MGSYSRSSRMFLRGLGVVYACLFYSLFSQWPGLYGCDGIQPMVTVMHRSIAHLPAGSSWWAAFTRLPSLLWLLVGSELSASPWQVDMAAEVLCLLGLGLAIAQVLSRRSKFLWTTCLLWMIHLSLHNLTETFNHFQWDLLLLETGFLAIFLAATLRRWNGEPVISLLRLLLFKLMFLSGMVKLFPSASSEWTKMTAMNGHYATQCIPTPVAYYLHNLPALFHETETAATLLIEGPLVFAILIPWAPVRRAAAIVQIALQVAIIASGNYNFFNGLTILLCLTLLDNAFWKMRTLFWGAFAFWGGLSLSLLNLSGTWVFMEILLLLCGQFRLSQRFFMGLLGTGLPYVLPFMSSFLFQVTHTGEVTHINLLELSYFRNLMEEYALHILLALFSVLLISWARFLWKVCRKRTKSLFPKALAFFLVFCCLILFAMTAPSLLSPFPSHHRASQDQLARVFGPSVMEWKQKLRMESTYGLFAQMTGVGPQGEVARPEVIMEAFNRGKWHPVEFHYKVGNMSKAPAFIAPYQPYLDWQMWFAALGSFQNNKWFVHLSLKLLQGSPDVFWLLPEQAGFSAAEPPTQIRAHLFEYDFAMADFALPEDHRALVDEERGTWWRRRKVGEYLPAVNTASLRQALSIWYNVDLTASCRGAPLTGFYTFLQPVQQALASLRNGLPFSLLYVSLPMALVAFL